jgi:hypothetical protein
MDEFIVQVKGNSFLFGTMAEAMQKAIELFQQKMDVSIYRKMSKESHRKYCVSPSYDWKKQYQEDPMYRNICRFDWDNRQGITF